MQGQQSIIVCMFLYKTKSSENRRTVCQITVNTYGFLFSFTTVGQASDKGEVGAVTLV